MTLSMVIGVQSLLSIAKKITNSEDPMYKKCLPLARAPCNAYRQRLQWDVPLRADGAIGAPNFNDVRLVI